MSRDNYKHDNNRWECQSNQFFFISGISKITFTKRKSSKKMFNIILTLCLLASFVVDNGDGRSINLNPQKVLKYISLDL